MPSRSASCATFREQGTPRILVRAPSLTSAPIRRNAHSAVVPPPRPTTMPDSTKSTARSAAILFHVSAVVSIVAYYRSEETGSS